MKCFVHRLAQECCQKFQNKGEAKSQKMLYIHSFYSDYDLEKKNTWLQ